MRNLIFFSSLLLLSTTAYADVVEVTKEITTKDFSLIIQMLKADAYTQKFLEYAITGVTALTGGLWFAFIGKSFQHAYRDIKNVGVSTLFFAAVKTKKDETTFN